MMETLKISVTGSVQGVGFRPFVYRIAVANGLVGYVKNEGGHVTIVVQGSEARLQMFLEDFKRKKPPLARVDEILMERLPHDKKYQKFVIETSVKGKSAETSYIPPDVSICDECIDDMLRGDRVGRKNYPFTSCVNCGPRFTIIWSIPYDRPNTEMSHFPMCNECLAEYVNPLDRRFHSQTTCCKTCGPNYWIQDKEGNRIADGDDVSKMLSRLLKEGNLVAIKGIGGTHVACDATADEVILRLRSVKGNRKYKPFALMADSITTIAQFAVISARSQHLLTSIRRPIVLLPKKDPFPLSEYVAPDLHNVGVMLPYAGLHVLLFKHLGSNPLVMTSANYSHQPILKDNDAILRTLKFVDYYVLHDRNIHQRADDSVLKTFSADEEVSLFIRRSRGHVPEPLKYPPSLGSSHVLLGCGPELHVTASLSVKGQIIPSQYLGDLKNPETFNFYQQAIDHLLNLFNVGPRDLDRIIVDFNPVYLSTEFGHRFSALHDIELVAVQHHVAHAFSLLLDAQWKDDALILAADGAGYGLDGATWGSEILFIPKEGNFQRFGHLKYVPMPGGDAATTWPARMLISYLDSLTIDEEFWTRLMTDILASALPHGSKEVELILRQIEKGVNVVPTSSMGRLLDALSLVFTGTKKMTYEGEPAMKLESFSMKGFYPPSEFESQVQLLKLPKKLEFQKNQLDVAPIFEFLLERNLLTNGPKDKCPKIAMTLLYLIANSFISEMIQVAEEQDIKALGFTGGVSYNEPILLMMKYRVKNERDLIWLQHRQVPPGDGGISIGQVFSVLRER